MFAQVSAAWDIWLRFALETGAVTEVEREAIEAEVAAALMALADEQKGLQRAHDPVDRFYALLEAALSSARRTSHRPLIPKPPRE